MELSGQVEIDAPRDRVWSLVSDPRKMSGCAAGLEQIEEVGPGRFRLATKVGSGLMSTRLTADLELVAEPPDRAAVTGTGEASGNSLDARGQLTLSGPPGGPTLIAWQATIAIRGPFASFDKLLEPTAAKVVAEAFDCLRSQLHAGG
ncbi:MAG TPA: SRPBCC domain-containing protein [Candidatus Limnocylindrales bacterium]|nr:SRPBCC domain-containing protein [Candidatus Limnocylindrales bacterium]